MLQYDKMKIQKYKLTNVVCSGFTQDLTYLTVIRGYEICGAETKDKATEQRSANERKIPHGKLTNYW